MKIGITTISDFFKVTFIICATIVFFRPTVGAQSVPPTVEIPGTQLIKYTSQIVAGQEYDLLINLPGDYQRNTGKKS